MTSTTAPAGRNGNLVAAIATIACCDIAMGLTFQLLPLLMEQRQVPAWIMGLNAAMSPLGILLAGPLLPRIVSHVGSKRVVYTVIAAIIICLAIFKLTESLLAWFLVRFAFGIAAGTLFSVSEAWVLTFAERGNRGRIMGIYTTVLSVSFAIGPAIIPLTGINGWMPWLIGMVCVAASAAPLALITVSEDAFRDGDGGSFFRFIARAPLLLFAVSAVTIFDSILLSFFPIFGLRSGLTLQTVSWVLAAGIIGNVFMQYPIGWLADHWSRMGVIVTSAIATVVLSLAIIWAVHSWMIWPVVVLVGSTAFAVYTVTLAVLGDNFDGPDLIAGSAAFGVMWGVGGLVGPPIAGFAIDWLGINAVPVTLSLAYVVLLLGLLMTGGRLVAGSHHG
jgi:MFS family permease